MGERFEAKRKRAVERLRTALEKRGSPRAQMLVIVVAAGSAGFLCSFVLLHLGLRVMWLRYWLAIGLAYGVFLLLIGAWVGRQRRKLARPEIHWRGEITAEDVVDLVAGDPIGSAVDAARGVGRLAAKLDPGHAPGDPASQFVGSFDPGTTAVRAPSRFTGGGGHFGGGGASGSFEPPNAPLAESPSLGDAAPSGAGGAGGDLGLDLDDAVVIVALLAAVAAAFAASVWVVVSAPALFAEVLFDAALSAGLYRRLRRLDGRLWWESAIRRTWVPVLLTTIAFAAAGWVMQGYAPGAASIGAVWEHMQEPTGGINR